MRGHGSFEPILSSKAATFLLQLSKTHQRRLIELCFKLADNPYQVGDYSEPDDTGREIQFILIQAYVIAFWADHAVKELRIVSIEEV